MAPEGVAGVTSPAPQQAPAPGSGSSATAQGGWSKEGVCGDALGFSRPWSAEGSCLTPSLSFWLPCRTSHSRAKAEAAVTAAQKAQEEARIARITAKEFSPSFQHRENGQCVPPRCLAPRSCPSCSARPRRDPKPSKTSPAQRLGALRHVRGHSSCSSSGLPGWETAP